MASVVCVLFVCVSFLFLFASSTSSLKNGRKENADGTLRAPHAKSRLAKGPMQGEEPFFAKVDPLQIKVRNERIRDNGAAQVEVNWADVVAVSNSTTTLQVVGNPLLNPLTSPVAPALFENLAALGADLVRYVPWFPYPTVGLAEWDPPNYSSKTSYWNFTNIIPQFYGFMNATYGQGFDVVPNFSTQPTWMYQTDDWSYPTDPNVVDWSYPQGNAYPNTTQLVSEYYGRLLSWIMRGEFTDEFGVQHNGGPAYSKLNHWEVFNEPEGCHGLTAQTYTQQYDAVVQAIRSIADPLHQVQFVGLALSGRELDWITYFLNSSNHLPGIPLDLASFHFYASSNTRDDPDDFEAFFPQADGYLQELVSFTSARAQLSPTTKFSSDETGVILPDDNDQDVTAPPPIYWNAAGAMYAYLVSEMSKMGIEILGESQYVGTPPIPEWDIPDAQYPSVSMTNWTTGEGNARYWVLKLLIDEIGPGDKYVATMVGGNASNPFCGVVDGHVGYGTMTLQCFDQGATISKIDFAAFGTPTGTCGSYQHNPSCDASNVTAYVNAQCVGQASCSILSYPTFGDPCYDTYKQLVIQAECSSGNGAASPSATAVIYAQGIITQEGQKKILIVNKYNTPMSFEIDSSSGTISTVDEATGWGPARVQTYTSGSFTVAPFAVAVITQND